MPSICEGNEFIIDRDTSWAFAQEHVDAEILAHWKFGMVADCETRRIQGKDGVKLPVFIWTRETGPLPGSCGLDIDARIENMLQNADDQGPPGPRPAPGSRRLLSNRFELQLGCTYKTPSCQTW